MLFHIKLFSIVFFRSPKRVGLPLTLKLFYFGFDNLLITVRIDDMTELCLRMLGNIRFDLMPVFLVIAKLLTIGANLK